MRAVCAIVGVFAASAAALLPVELRADEPAPTARQVFQQLESAKDWRVAKKASDLLAKTGPEAMDVVRREAERHKDAKVRKACYEILIQAYSDDERVRKAIVNSGLADADSGVRYLCAFNAGSLKIYPAFRRLRVLISSDESDAQVRCAAAKSLAELGEANALPILYEALGSDRYMQRYMANLGIKALTGKDLNEFDYDYHEGAFVSGGKEAVFARRPIDDAKRKAGRFRAIAAYCTWLQKEHPELYKHLDGSF